MIQVRFNKGVVSLIIARLAVRLVGGLAQVVVFESLALVGCEAVGGLNAHEVPLVAVVLGDVV